MKQCPYCGNELSDDAKFCVECGKALPEEAPADPTAEVAPAEAPAVAEKPAEPQAPGAAPDMPIVTQVPSKKQMLSTLQIGRAHV